jgi:hypothetical protein
MNYNSSTGFGFKSQVPRVVVRVAPAPAAPAPAAPARKFRLSRLVKAVAAR